MPNEAPRVGFIGLGSQGGPMARRVVEEGFPLTIWARRTQSLESFADTDAEIASSPRQLGEASDIVGICVVADVDVEQVLLGEEGALAGMNPGTVVAIHSTVHPDTCIRLARAANARDVSIVDAPVSGGGAAAAEQKLVVMVGGEREAAERCRPVFATFADSVIHLGALGSGQMAKLLNNLVFTAHITMALETYDFADRLGIDRGALAQVLMRGSGGSRAAAILAANGFDTSGLRAQALPLLEKDTGLILDVARAKNASPPAHVAQLARNTLSMLSQTSGQSTAATIAREGSRTQ